jgi:metal transporter CNNM
MAGWLAPFLRFYEVILYPVARPNGWLLDRLVGPEGVPWFREKELCAVLYHQASIGETELDVLEATGASTSWPSTASPSERRASLWIPGASSGYGSPAGPRGCLVSRTIQRTGSSGASGKKWAVLVDAADEPRPVLNVHYFLRAVLLGRDGVDPGMFCHRPLVVRDARTPLGQVLHRLTVHPESAADDVIDRHIILVWSAHRRIITGSDLLGRLLRGIARRAPR